MATPMLSPHRVLIDRQLEFNTPSSLDTCPPSPVTHLIARAGSSTVSGSPVVNARAPPYNVALELPEFHEITEQTQHGAVRRSQITLHTDGNFEFRRWYDAGRSCRPVEASEESASGEWRIFQWDRTEDVLEISGSFTVAWPDCAARPLTLTKTMHLPWCWDQQGGGAPAPGAVWSEGRCKRTE
eukprot:TRINITY_DN1331_c0_g1_i1.p1 TRINITY_DN1331_c0_g1~~TRINITY_DN1331_c0_g1_i1.p1  ORF type:complete len:184 (-),score=31.86 TRINITY_DN1331_c0_g1_i1:306-857(-)